MNTIETRMDDYLITTDAAKIDVKAVHDYLNRSYWAAGIPKEVVEKSIANSLCFAILHNGAVVGFARLITDMATFAYLADVYILEEHRGKGLSKWLMQTIQSHPELQSLRRWLLATRDAHGLYEQFGWTYFTEDGTKNLMQRHNPNVYKGNTTA